MKQCSYKVASAWECFGAQDPRLYLPSMRRLQLTAWACRPHHPWSQSMLAMFPFVGNALQYNFFFLKICNMILNDRVPMTEKDSDSPIHKYTVLVRNCYYRQRAEVFKKHY